MSGSRLQKRYPTRPLQQCTAAAASTFPHCYVFIGGGTVKFFPHGALSLLTDVCERFRKQWLSLIELRVEPPQIHDVTFGLSCWHEAGQIKGWGLPPNPAAVLWSPEQERWNRPSKCLPHNLKEASSLKTPSTVVAVLKCPTSCAQTLFKKAA